MSGVQSEEEKKLIWNISVLEAENHVYRTGKSWFIYT